MSVTCCALIGKEVSVSLSPLIHQHFAAQFDLPFEYRALSIEPNQVKDTIQQLIKQKYCGVNITCPYKLSIHHMINNHIADANAQFAVNTLVLRSDQQTVAHNTDGMGFIQDLSYRQININQAKVFILGAGGSCYGILPALLKEQPKQITVACRNPIKAKTLLDHINHPQLQWCDLNCPPQHQDLIINTLPPNINPMYDFRWPQSWIKSNTFFYDLNYQPQKLWHNQLSTHGTMAYCDGKGMLIEQAALSFALWTSFKPSTEEIRAKWDLPLLGQ